MEQKPFRNSSMKLCSFPQLPVLYLKTWKETDLYLSLDVTPPFPMWGVYHKGKLTHQASGYGWCHFGKIPSSFYKTKPTSTLDSASPILCIYLRQMKTNAHKKKSLCINVYNNSKLETARMSICRWISYGLFPK